MTLEFRDADIENEYQEWRYDGSVAKNRFACFVAGAGFTILDHALRYAEVPAPGVAMVIYGILLPALAVVFALTFTEAWRVVGPYATPGTVLLCGLAAMAIHQQLPPSNGAVMSYGVMGIVLLVGYVMTSMSPRIAVFVGVALSVVFAFHVQDLWARSGQLGEVTPFVGTIGIIIYLTFLNFACGVVSYSLELHSRRAFHQERVIDDLICSVLPESVADRMKRGERDIVDNYENVTVMFADIVGFTRFSAQFSPGGVVNVLNWLFSRFDELARKHGLEKIKTIGDGYMVAGGLAAEHGDHANAAVAMALEMREVAAELGLELRVGIHSGPVVAGVIGRDRFAYDLWGDTVNVASRMESQGEDGSIQVSKATQRLLDGYKLTDRGRVDVKGKGPMHVFLVEGRSAPVVFRAQPIALEQPVHVYSRPTQVSRDSADIPCVSLE